jgi:TolB-like protein
LIAAGAAVAILAAVVVWMALRYPAPPAPADLPAQKQLAVFPFRDLTGDDRDRLIADGLLETVSVRLSGLPGLQVVNPVIVAKAVARHRENLDAAREMGAILIVVPTLQRQKDDVRLTYRLIDVRTGAEIASAVMEGQASDLFSLQDGLADTVAKDLNVTAARRRSICRRASTRASRRATSRRSDCCSATIAARRSSRRLGSRAAWRPSGPTRHPCRLRSAREPRAVRHHQGSGGGRTRHRLGGRGAVARSGLPQVDVTVGQTSS